MFGPYSFEEARKVETMQYIAHGGYGRVYYDPKKDFVTRPVARDLSAYSSTLTQVEDISAESLISGVLFLFSVRRPSISSTFQGLAFVTDL